MQYNVTSGRLLALCVLLQVAVRQASALFGDDAYWKAQKNTDCSLEKLAPKYVCDGIVHCDDESDEQQCTKCQGRTAFHCTNNRCTREKEREKKYDNLQKKKNSNCNTSRADEYN